MKKNKKYWKSQARYWKYIAQSKDATSDYFRIELNSMTSECGMWESRAREVGRLYLKALRRIEELNYGFTDLDDVKAKLDMRRWTDE